MGRPKTEIRVSLKSAGKTTRLNIVPMFDGTFLIYRDGQRRGIVSTTEFGKRIARWLRSSQEAMARPVAEAEKRVRSPKQGIQMKYKHEAANAKG